MITLGVRVKPNEVDFSIFDSDESKIINVESINVPKAFNMPEKLKYIRSFILDLLIDYKVEKCGIKITENNSKSLSIERLYIEGVIQETFASSSIIKYKTYVLSQLAREFNTTSSKLKSYINKKDDVDINIDFDLTKFSKEKVEAILSAMAVAK